MTPKHAPGCAGVALAAVLLALAARPAAAAAAGGRLVYIAIDGLGADQVEVAMASGLLPHLTDLRAHGGLVRLPPSLPATEEQLWTSFALGAGPGRHGVIADTEPGCVGAASTRFRIEPPSFWFGQIRKTPPRVAASRPGKPFWSRLDAHGIPVELLFLPFTFPPDTLAHGRMLSGLGTPDLRLTRSTFTLLTARPLAAARVTVPGGELVLVEARADEQGQVFSAELEGPPDPRQGGKRLRAPVRIRLDPSGTAAHVEVAGTRYTVRQGEWGRALPVEFAFSPFSKVRGHVRPYLLALEPLSIYLTPLNIDPEAPYVPIAYPPGFAAELAGHVGRFDTVGWVEDTFALAAGVLGEKPFGTSVVRTVRMRATLVERELEREDWRFLAAAFLAPDRLGHTVAPPGGAAGIGAPLPRDMETVARQLDELVGRVHEQLRPEDQLIVFSTHGMAAVHREFDLGAWLVAEGYLAPAGPRDGATGDSLGVDWSRTRAVMCGPGGISVARSGREGTGGGTTAHESQLLAEIRTKLEQLVDAETGEHPIAAVLRGDSLCAGPDAGRCPDLVLVCRAGYSIAPAGIGTGGVTGRFFAPSPAARTGEHTNADPELVAGFAITDVPPAVAVGTVADLAATALAHFGAARPADMTGQPLASGR